MAVNPAQIPFLNWLKDVNRATLKDDLIAGITGAVIVLPQGVAFALIAGLPPIYGLYTAMITPIVAALFGSSYHLISGPTTAISIVVFSSISQFAEPGAEQFIQLAFLLTLMAGIIQLVLGIARMGQLINFVSHSVVVGFTAGAAILIGVSQLKHVFGINVSKGATFFETIIQLVKSIGETNLYFLGIALFTFLIAFITKRIAPRLPNMLIAMILGSVLAYVINGEAHGVTTVGEMPRGLPPFNIPPLNYSNIIALAPNAFAVALLGLIEAVAIGRSIAIKTHQQIDGNQEFIGQGLSNIVGSFFSCYAGSGSFTRSGVNYEAGAKTPMAAIFAAILLMVIMLLVAPYAAYLPIPAMAGIIVLVAYNLIDFHHISQILKASKAEFTVLTTTFVATLFLQLEFAIYFGVFLSLVFYLQRTSRPLMAVVAPDPKNVKRKFYRTQRKKLDTCPQLKIIRIDGSLFYGAVSHVAKELDRLTKGEEKHYLIIANGINIIDVSGAELLVNEAEQLRSHGKQLYLCGLKKGAREFLKNGGYWKSIGNDNIFTNKQEAIEDIFERLDRNICATCKTRIFTECAGIPEGSS